MPKANHQAPSSRSFLVLAFAAFVLIALTLSYFIFRTPQTSNSATSLGTASLPLQEKYGQIPLRFEANHEQVADPVKFLTRAPGHSLYLTPTEAVLTGHTNHQQSCKYGGNQL